MKFHQILSSEWTKWSDLEKEIEKMPNTKLKGDIFEDFIFCYLLIKRDLYQIEKHYRAKDIPNDLKKKYGLEKNDCGVDGLILFQNGKVGGYQVKFRTNREKPKYEELAKFWAESRNMDYQYTIANSYGLTNLTKKNEKHISILVDEFDSLDLEFFKELKNIVDGQPIIKEYYSPATYQEKMIEDVAKGFSSNDRGKLIAACGTGKTLTSLWISERIGARKILFLAPSLALIKQTLHSWTSQSHERFNFLCVCSDKTVSGDIDSGDISTEDLGIPVSTLKEDIILFLEKTYTGKSIIFATYQSLEILSQSINSVHNYELDLIIFDEAHRTAGTNDSGLFSLALHNENIPSRKRLFMTATERLVKPWIIEKAQEMDREIFSMDNKELYGPTFHRFSFGEAIDQKIISDYRIVLSGIRDNEIYNWIKQNKFLAEQNKDSITESYTYASNVFKQTVLIRAMKDLGIRKCVTFHSTVKYAKDFIEGASNNDYSFKKSIEATWDKQANDFFLSHINGTMSTGDRKEILDNFAVSKYGVISNSRCLTEGVDVPIIDSIYFVDPKKSLIDIIQACGRALRKSRDGREKIAYFIIPILIPAIEGEDTINNANFEMLHNLIQSLRDQDQRLEQWVDSVNLNAIKGKTHKFSRNNDSPIILNLPQNFDIRSFEENIFLRIAEVNKNSSNQKIGIVYGKSERKSSYKRIFKTLGDYSVKSYEDNLIKPTLQKFRNSSDIVDGSELKVNHNNVSHTVRLGLINKHTNSNYGITEIGKLYMEGELDFNTLFKGQMLKYFSTEKDVDSGSRMLFPYRSYLEILIEVGSISFHEFVFSIYTLTDSKKDSINNAVQGIMYLKDNYPNIDIISSNNQKEVLDELNQYFGTNYSEHDIWHKKTTVNNQYIYFRNHLGLFSEYLTIQDRYIIVKEDQKVFLQQLLDQSNFLQNEKNERILSHYYISNSR